MDKPNEAAKLLRRSSTKCRHVLVLEFFIMLPVIPIRLGTLLWETTWFLGTSDAGKVMFFVSNLVNCSFLFSLLASYFSGVVCLIDRRWKYHFWGSSFLTLALTGLALVVALSC